jgi:hypothetical protein
MAFGKRGDVGKAEAQGILQAHLDAMKRLRESNQLKEFFQKIAPPGREERGKDLSEALGMLGGIVKK